MAHYKENKISTIQANVTSNETSLHGKVNMFNILSGISEIKILLTELTDFFVLYGKLERLRDSN